MTKNFKSSRLEAFSDGVLAIIITIMVLEFKVPKADDLENITYLLPIFISYVLSFIHIGIYWNNHHHLFQAVEHINGKVMWANLNLLFWLSLLPFATAWMGENHFTKWPVIVYGVILIMCGLAFYILVQFLVASHSNDSALVRAINRNKKELFTIGIYTVAIGLAFLNAYISLALYFVVAVIWFIPDTRIEQEVVEDITPDNKED